MHMRWLFCEPPAGRAERTARGRQQAHEPRSAADHVSKIENRGSSVPIAYSLTERTQHVRVADGRDRALYVEITV
jgi:hypothetical protein